MQNLWSECFYFLHNFFKQYYVIGICTPKNAKLSRGGRTWKCKLRCFSEHYVLWEEVFVSHTHILLQRLWSARLWGEQRPKITAEPSSCVLSLRRCVQKVARVGTTACGSAMTRNNRKAGRSVDARESWQAIDGNTCNNATYLIACL